MGPGSTPPSPEKIMTVRIGGDEGVEVQRVPARVCKFSIASHRLVATLLVNLTHQLKEKGVLIFPFSLFEWFIFLD